MRTVSHRRWVALVAALVTLAIGASGAAMTIQSPVPLIVDICDGCPAPQATIPLTLGGVESGRLHVRAVAIAFGTKNDGVPQDVVTPTLSNEGGQVRLALTIKDGHLREQGTYTVVLEFTAEGNPPQTVSVQLRRTPAAVRPLGTLVVERVFGNPFRPAASQAKPPLTLVESSGRTGLTRLQFLPPSGGSVNAAAVSISATPRACRGDGGQASQLAIAPDGAACFDYELTGDFPLGIESRAHTVTAPELQAPVPIAFEIRSRLARPYVLVFAFAGLVCSYVLKVVSQRRLEWKEAQVLADDLLTKVEADVLRHPDTTFTDPLQEPLTALRTVKDEPDAAAIGTARTALEDAWRKGLLDLATRRQAAQQSINGLRSLVLTRWEAPAPVLDELAKAKGDVDALQLALAADRVTAVTNRSDELRSDIGDGIRTTIEAWQGETKLFLRAIETAPAGLSSDVKQAIAPAIADAAGTVETTRLGDGLRTIDELLQAMQGVSNERRKVRTMVLLLTAVLDQEIDRVGLAASLERQSLAEPEAALAATAKALADGLDRPDRRVSEVLRAIETAWRAAATRVFGRTLTAEIDALLRQQRFADVMVKASAPPGADADFVPAGAPAVAPRIVTFGSDAAPIARFGTAMPDFQPPAAQLSFRARTIGQIAAIKAWQSLAVAVLAGLVAYGIYAPKFVGDYQDFVAIFFWAFGLDLTVDAVTRLGSAVRR